jgi:MarR family transcriptional regulator for hemolysin
MDKFDQTLMDLTMTLTHAARSYIGATDKMAGAFDLSHATAWPIVMIGRLGDGVRPGTVANALGLEPPSLVRVIEQLVVAKLVERRDDPGDRRAKTLHLTASGRSSAVRLEAALSPFRRQLFANIDAADIAACARVLTQLDLTLDDLETARRASKAI